MNKSPLHSEEPDEALRPASPRAYETTYVSRQRRSPQRCRHPEHLSSQQDPVRLNAHCEICAVIAMQRREPEEKSPEPWEKSLRTSPGRSPVKRIPWDSRGQRMAHLPEEFRSRSFSPPERSLSSPTAKKRLASPEPRAAHPSKGPTHVGLSPERSQEPLRVPSPTAKKRFVNTEVYYINHPGNEIPRDQQPKFEFTAEDSEYYYYIIKPGDTLRSISESTHVSEQLIRSANNIMVGTDGSVIPHTTLRIPRHGASLDATRPYQHHEEPIAPGSLYVTLPGDTLQSVSARSGLSEQALLDRNPSMVRSDGTLVSSSRVIIPKLQSPKANKTQGQEDFKFYSVRSGETLLSISEATGVSKRVLEEYNSTTTLVPGAILRPPTAGSLLPPSPPHLSVSPPPQPSPLPFTLVEQQRTPSRKPHVGTYDGQDRSKDPEFVADDNEYHYYTVRARDTLSSIALCYNVSEDSLRAANPVSLGSNASVLPNMFLRIPHTSDAKNHAPAPSPPRQQWKTSSNGDFETDEFRSVVVNPKETLEDFADRNGVSLDTVLRWNDILVDQRDGSVANASIRVPSRHSGPREQQLNIYEEDLGSAPPSGAQFSPRATPGRHNPNPDASIYAQRATEEDEYYLVRPGDTVKYISELTNVPECVLRDANPSMISLDGLVRPNISLIIPRANAPRTARVPSAAFTAPPSPPRRHEGDRFLLYRIHSGDTLKSVAESAGTTTQSLRDFNNISAGADDSLLMTGTMLRIPIPEDSQPPRYHDYYARQGDTIRTIASYHNIEEHVLLELNRAVAGRDGSIAPNTAIRIPISAMPPTSPKRTESQRPHSTKGAGMSYGDPLEGRAVTETHGPPRAPGKEGTILHPKKDMDGPRSTGITNSGPSPSMKAAAAEGLGWHNTVGPGDTLQQGVPEHVEHVVPPPRGPALRSPSPSIDAITEGNTFWHYLVQPGDTLLSISQRSGVNEFLIYDANPIAISRSGTVTPGTSLRIPKNVDQPPKSPSPSSSSVKLQFGENLVDTTKKREGLHNGGGIAVAEDDDYWYYIVRVGDTLQSISAAYGISDEPLRKANEFMIGADGSVLPNTAVRIPRIKPIGTSVPTSAGTVNENAHAVTEDNEYWYYVTRTGDTLHSLAQRSGVTDQDLRDANPVIIGPDDSVLPNTSIRIPRNPKMSVNPTKLTVERTDVIVQASRDKRTLPNESRSTPNHGGDDPRAPMHSPPRRPDPSTDSKDEDYRYYIIRPEDNLLSIAQQSGVTIEVLKGVNPVIIGHDNSIIPNTVLRIPRVPSAQTPLSNVSLGEVRSVVLDSTTYVGKKGHTDGPGGYYTVPSTPPHPSASGLKSLGEGTSTQSAPSVWSASIPQQNMKVLSAVAEFYGLYGWQVPTDLSSRVRKSMETEQQSKCTDATLFRCEAILTRHRCEVYQYAKVLQMEVEDLFATVQCQDALMAIRRRSEVELNDMYMKQVKNASEAYKAETANAKVELDRVRKTLQESLQSLYRVENYVGVLRELHQNDPSNFSVSALSMNTIDAMVQLRTAGGSVPSERYEELRTTLLLSRMRGPDDPTTPTLRKELAQFERDRVRILEEIAILEQRLRPLESAMDNQESQHAAEHEEHKVKFRDFMNAFRAENDRRALDLAYNVEGLSTREQRLDAIRRGDPVLRLLQAMDSSLREDFMVHIVKLHSRCRTETQTITDFGTKSRTVSEYQTRTVIGTKSHIRSETQTITEIGTKFAAPLPHGSTTLTPKQNNSGVRMSVWFHDAELLLVHLPTVSRFELRRFDGSGLAMTISVPEISQLVWDKIGTTATLTLPTGTTTLKFGSSNDASTFDSIIKGVA